MPDDADLCGIDGPDEAPITHKAFNRWAARAMRHHVRPMKDTLAKLDGSVNSLVSQQAQLQARIEGALWALRFTIWVVGGVLALIVVTANFPDHALKIIKFLGHIG